MTADALGLKGRGGTLFVVVSRLGVPVLDDGREHNQLATMSNRPTFLRKKEVAAILRIGPRQVDRLIAAGKLERVKTSANRSTIPDTSLVAYLAEQTSKAPADAERYVSPVRTVCLNSDDGPLPPGAVATIDAVLSKAMPGVVVVETGDSGFEVSWAVSLGYTIDDLGKVLERAEQRGAINSSQGVRP